MLKCWDAGLDACAWHAWNETSKGVAQRQACKYENETLGWRGACSTRVRKAQVKNLWMLRRVHTVCAMENPIRTKGCIVSWSLYGMISTATSSNSA
eukprot:1149922-Pelagomonas_calceolata.AAC.5